MLHLLVIGKDRASLESFLDGSDAAGIEDPSRVIYLIENGSPGVGLGKLANRHILLAKQEGASVFGVCHADCTFGPGAFDAFERSAMQGYIAGIVGRDLQGRYHWSNGQANGPGIVSTLDGSCCFFRIDSALRFDEATFDSHHCCVEDLCLQAAAKGIGSIVPAAVASHRGESTQSPRWQAAYWHYRAKLERKYSGVKFMTT